MTELRTKFIDLTNKNKNIDLTDTEIKDLEIGIFNWTIDFADAKQVIKNWENEQFKKIYINKCVSILSNLDNKSYLKNLNLNKNVKNKNFLPHEVPYLETYRIYPEKWNHIIDDIHKKEEAVKNNKNISTTDQFKCGKCKKRECSYYELQIRSADESAPLFITCLNCGAHWKQ